jgi:hypothetical protein
MTSAIIGYTGFIGKYLCRNTKFDYFFNSENIDEITKNSYDVVYCAAPHGNRILSSADPAADCANVEKLISSLTKLDTNRFILIGTVDALVSNRDYGKNRKLLEDFVKQNFHSYNIVRLSSLIFDTIQKNLLYDLKHQQWLESINPESTLQWYPLEKIIDDIAWAVDNRVNELNLVSEPVNNLEIIQQFAPNCLASISEKKDATHYNITPYRFSKKEIFSYIERYMQQ